MKKLFVTICLLVVSLPLYSQTVIGFDAFDPAGDTYYSSPLTFTEDGYPFTLTTAGGRSTHAFMVDKDFPREFQFGDNALPLATVKITITHRDSWLFDFKSIDLLTTITVTDWVVKGYKDGVQVTGSPYAFSLVRNAGFVTISPDFLQVDEVTLEENPASSLGITLWCDHFVVDNVTDASLPVSLASFSAHQQGAAVMLNWVTESETNNTGYIIERKADGAEWLPVASCLTDNELLGQGNTSEQTMYDFIDEAVEGGQTYSYRLSDVDFEGNVTVLDVINITLDDVPTETVLKPVYPNPFNPATKIQYELAEDLSVLLKVVDIRGRHVQTIVQGEHKTAGVYSIHWNGQSESGINAPSGVYFLMLQAGDVMRTQKVMLVR